MLEAEDVIAVEETSKSELYELNFVTCQGERGDTEALGDGVENVFTDREHEGCPLVASAGEACSEGGSVKLCQETLLPGPVYDRSSDRDLATGNESGMPIKTLRARRRKPSRGASRAKFVLSPNLLGHAPEMVSGNRSSPRVTFGKVFHRCKITLTQYPIMHQCLILFPSSSGHDASWKDSAEGICQSLSALLSLEVTIVPKECTDTSGNDFTKKSSLVIEMEESSMLCNNVVNIGQFGLCHLPEGDAACCLLNLDLIAMIRYEVQDIRLFWSKDERVFNKFVSNSCQSENSCQDKNSPDKLNGLKHKPKSKFLPFSLHPPTYTHDVSFWLTDDSFDELRFCSVIRSVTFDLVREVHFLNQYINRKISYTYRLVYQSCDGALSKQAATQLQLNVRQAINKWLGLEPR